MQTAAGGAQGVQPPNLGSISGLQALLAQQASGGPAMYAGKLSLSNKTQPMHDTYMCFADGANASASE